MDPSTEGAPGRGVDDRAMEGVVHLQAAAREAIEAVRALLDVAEELVEDPAAAQALAGSVGSVLSGLLGRVRPGGDGARTGSADDPPDDSRIQRIRVS